MTLFSKGLFSKDVFSNQHSCILTFSKKLLSNSFTLKKKEKKEKTFYPELRQNQYGSTTMVSWEMSICRGHLLRCCFWQTMTSLLPSPQWSKKSKLGPKYSMKYCKKLYNNQRAMYFFFLISCHHFAANKTDSYSTRNRIFNPIQHNSMKMTLLWE